MRTLFYGVFIAGGLLTSFGVTAQGLSKQQEQGQDTSVSLTFSSFYEGYWPTYSFASLEAANQYLDSLGYYASFLAPTHVINKTLLYEIDPNKIHFPGKLDHVTSVAADIYSSANCGPGSIPAGSKCDPYNDTNLCNGYVQATPWKFDLDDSDYYGNLLEFTAKFTVTVQGCSGAGWWTPPGKETVSVHQGRYYTCTPPRADHIGSAYLPIYYLKDTGKPTTVCTADPGSLSAQVVDSSYHNKTKKSCSAGADPIDLSTGNIYEEVTDLVIHSPMLMVISRHYDTHNGWLFSNTDYTTGYEFSEEQEYIILHRSNGQQWYFNTAYSSDGQSVNGSTGNFIVKNGYYSQGLYWAPNGFKYYFQTNSDNLSDTGALGRLMRIVNARGLIETLHYDAKGNLTSISDAFGHSLAIVSHHSSRNATILFDSVTDPAGHTIDYHYNSQDDLTEVDYPSGRKLYYQYSDATHPSLLTAILDTNHHMVSQWTYNAQGQAMSNTMNQS